MGEKVEAADQRTLRTIEDAVRLLDEWIKYARRRDAEIDLLHYRLELLQVHLTAETHLREAFEQGLIHG